MSDRREDTNATKAIDNSGFPFQLAVERELRALGPAVGWKVSATEVPIADGFADIVLERDGFLAVVECKRVQGATWHFLVPKGASANVSGCRVEWRNARARGYPAHIPGLPLSKLFAAECTMCQGSYESSECILPKDGPTRMLEPLARGLLSQTHALGDAYGVEYGAGVTYLIPVLVTNAALSVCEYDPETLDLQKGVLGQARFVPVDFLRFRKAMVSDRSNDYDRDDMPLNEWAADRHRTVFIVTPAGLRTFLSGFRVFEVADGNDVPPEFLNPPHP